MTASWRTILMFIFKRVVRRNGLAADYRNKTTQAHSSFNSITIYSTLEDPHTGRDYTKYPHSCTYVVIKDLLSFLGGIIFTEMWEWRSMYLSSPIFILWLALNHRKLRQISRPHTSLFTTNLFKSLANEMEELETTSQELIRKNLQEKLKLISSHFLWRIKYGVLSPRL